MYVPATEGQECTDEILGYNLPNQLKANSYLWKQILDLQKDRTADYNSIRERDQNDKSITRWDRKRNEDLYRKNNMPRVAQVINDNKLRWFGRAMR